MASGPDVVPFEDGPYRSDGFIKLNDLQTIKT